MILHSRSAVARTFLQVGAASIAATALIATAGGAAAEPQPAAPVATGTGSSALDAGSAAAQSAGWFAQRGDVLGLLILLGVTPFQMLTGGVCDLATLSALPSPCPAPKAY
ncbi:hypothetical protein IU433_05105 [Nocardia puris]|uniref:hypothetical protein n=1 Tax=Nocardia puris TaxID=208602 RepID=UPI001895D8DC|nr:hypothetical protein [Nocardia puris]MBF6209668.1 hypothetical protein [Nocardia puris]MBF6366240.1 hypothetical protein [Nocardia puris]MBF6458421.1 hypothetical protein [Nocardia puris]